MRELGGRFAKAAAGIFRYRASAGSIAGGLVTAVLVVAIGLALAIFRSQAWTATSSLVVLPSTGQLSQSETASYYDTLSRGQIVATFAQIIQSQNNPVQQPDSVGLTSDQAQRVNVTVTAVPNTAIINIKVDAPTADQAAQVAGRVAAVGQGMLQQLKTPYTAAIVNSAAPKLVAPAGPSTLTLGLVIAVVAVVAGVGAQQILWVLGLAAARRSVPGTSAPQSAPAHPSPVPGKQPPADGRGVSSPGDPLTDSRHPHPPVQDPADTSPQSR